MLTVTKTERPVGSAFMTVFAAFRAVSRKFSTPRSVFQMDTTGPWRTNPSALGTTYDVPWAGSLYVLRLHYFATVCPQTAARPVASACQPVICPSKLCGTRGKLRASRGVQRLLRRSECHAWPVRVLHRRTLGLRTGRPDCQLTAGRRWRRSRGLGFDRVWLLAANVHWLPRRAACAVIGRTMPLSYRYLLAPVGAIRSL